jgi:hypothetical protein
MAQGGIATTTPMQKAWNKNKLVEKAMVNCGGIFSLLFLLLLLSVQFYHIV